MAKPPKDPNDEQVIEQRAVQLLSRREQSEFELVQKLCQRGFNRPAVLHVVERLQARRWQSDERFAEMFYRSRVEQGYGPLKIKAEMQQRGINSVLIETIFADAATDWRALAVERYRRKYGRYVPTDIDVKERSKRQRFLAQRGFSMDQVYSAERAAQESDENAG